MSHVPTHEEIRAAAASITDAIDRRRRDPHVNDAGAFWATGPWNDWMRFVPERLAVSAGDPDAVEHAIVFLEVDLRCDGSGYEKEGLLRALSSVDLEPDQISRLEVVLMRLVREGRRELIEAIRFARAKRSPSLKPQLRALLATADDATAFRALRALLGVRRPRLDGAARKRTRSLLEQGSWWRTCLTEDEVRRAIAASWGIDWERSLIRQAVSGPGKVTVVRLLALAPGVRIDVTDRPALVMPILRAIEPGDYRALRLAPPAWCPEMEAALFELLGSDDHVLTDAVAELLDELSTQ